MNILVLTMFDDDDSVFAAMRAGTRCYLLKGAEGDETVRNHVSTIFSKLQVADRAEAIVRDRNAGLK